MNIKNDSVLFVRLQEIAYWWGGCTEISPGPSIIAEVPILQRGLVWKPQQIEFLWDSLFRGFPIGSLIVCRKVKEQEKKESEEATHHLLDGQQRSYAIYRGFAKWKEEEQNVCLWIDLDPKLEEDSSRKYLFRLTTQAHPWGYTKKDDCGRLSVRERFKDEGKHLVSFDEGPVQAGCPLPLFILLEFEAEEDKCDGAEAFFNYLKMKCRDFLKYPWATKVDQWVTDTLSLSGITPKEAENRKTQIKLILKGTQRAKKTFIAVQQIPKDLIYSDFENKGKTEIDVLEQVFQRVNRQGSRLDGEELAYSMIKAYLPDIAHQIDKISKNKMPASRLVNMAVKCALSKRENLQIKDLSIPRIRKCAHDEKEKILEYVGIHEDGESGELKKACGAIQTLWEDSLISYLQTSITMKSPSVYLLLLWIYKYWGNKDTNQKDECQWKGNTSILLGMSTLIHFFVSKGNHKDKIVSLIVEECRKRESLRDGIIEGIHQAFNDANNWIPPIHSPEVLRRKFGLEPGTDNKFSEGWTWWKCFIHDDQREIQLNNERNYGGWVNMLNNRELLLVVQKEYIKDACKNYDPANKELWEDHNRTWDYDHIIPYCFYYKRGVDAQKKLIQEWINRIGNLRAVKFEDNRSAQAAKFGVKCPGNWEDFCISEEVGNYFKESEGNEEETSLATMEMCQVFTKGAALRLCSIYEKCCKSFHWSSIVPEHIWNDHEK